MDYEDDDYTDDYQDYTDELDVADDTEAPQQAAWIPPPDDTDKSDVTDDTEQPQPVAARTGQPLLNDTWQFAPSVDTGRPVGRRPTG